MPGPGEAEGVAGPREGPPGPGPRGASRRASLGGGVVVAAATLALMLATEPRLAIVLDEGFTLGRQARVRDWLRAVRDPSAFAASWRPPPDREDLVQPGGPPPPGPDEVDTRDKLFGPRAMDWFWPFAREEPHGHPPFYAILGLLGDVLAPSRAPLPRARLGPMIAFAVTGGALFAFLARRRGIWAGTLAASAWAGQPRLFAHGHYALYDAPLTCLWVGAILAFWLAVEPGERPSRNPRWGRAVAFGVLAGAAAGTKLTGWFLPIPFVAWSVLYRDGRALRTLAVGGLVAAVVLYALTPPWWGRPIGGLDRFFRSNLTRDRTTYIPTHFLGQTYLTPQGSLPWYNTLVVTAVVTPVGFLALAVAGAGWALRRSRGGPLWTLPVVHWAALLVLRALPHVPAHDAERQFLPAFGCLALLAGMGASWAVEALGRRGKALVVVAMAEGAVSVAAMMPVPLSYYSPIVGGLPGAVRLGMEPTYYWDALSDDALGWLNAHTPPGEAILLPSAPTSFRYLRQVGKLKVEPVAVNVAERLGIVPAWYVVQNRTGALSPQERALVARAGPANVLVARWGVPLVWAFPKLGPATRPQSP